jgi:hypothetical protein
VNRSRLGGDLGDGLVLLSGGEGVSLATEGGDESGSLQLGGRGDAGAVGRVAVVGGRCAAGVGGGWVWERERHGEELGELMPDECVDGRPCGLDRCVEALEGGELLVR